MYRGRTVRLAPTQAEIAFMLSRRWPQSVPPSALIAGIYGGLEPDNAGSTTKVQVYHTRKKLQLIGVDIKFTWSRGYRLVLA